MPFSPRPSQVLYIEDDRLNIVLMEEVFRQWPDCTLLCAETGAEALACLAAQGFDLVLMDMNLPDTDGLTLLARLRHAGHHVPCIALSADVFAEAVQQAREAGFADYWTKPIDVPRLQTALQDLLQSPSGMAGRSATPD